MFSIVDMCFFAVDLCSPERSFGAMYLVPCTAGPRQSRGTQADAALGSAAVPRPSASSLMPLRRAPRRPESASVRARTGCEDMGSECIGIQLLRTSNAGRRGQWGECCSEIKEEAWGKAPGRGTFAEALTPLPSTSTNAQALASKNKPAPARPKPNKSMNLKSLSSSNNFEPGMNAKTHFNWSTP